MNWLRNSCLLALLCFGVVSCGTRSDPLVPVKSFNLERNAELVQRLARDHLSVNSELRSQQKKHTLWTNPDNVRAVTGLVEQLRLEDRVLAEPGLTDRAMKSPAEVERDRLQRLGRELAAELVGAGVLSARIALSGAEQGRLVGSQASRIVAVDLDLVMTAHDEQVVKDCRDTLARRLRLEPTPDRDPIHVNCTVVAWEELKSMLPVAAAPALGPSGLAITSSGATTDVDTGMPTLRVAPAPVRPFVWTIYAIAVGSLLGNVALCYAWWRTRRGMQMPRVLPAQTPSTGRGA